MMKYFLFSGLLVLTLSASAADHNPILPQPRKIVYGKGQLTLKGLTIGFATNPCSEDKFAAQTLAGIISKITAINSLVKETPGSSASIILERIGNVDPLPVPGEKTGPDSRESYKIKVTSKDIRIIAKSSAGLFYGVQTLRQMIEGSGDNAIIPEVEIEDWPSLAYRGYMMDMSHSQFFKIEEIKNQIDFLSRWKANWYLFYSEASIELEGFPLLMADARYTKKQIKEIIDYAKERHIDVIPNMELYGHMHDLFRLEHYSDMAVIPHGGEFNPDDPRVKPLVDNWVIQMSQLFPSPFFHIGFDEAWMLAYHAEQIGKTPEELYLRMLKQTTDIVEKQGKRALVWADMLQKFPATIPKVSQKIIAVSWHLSALSEESYEQMFGPFLKAGIEMITQGASRNYVWVAPDFEESFLNADMLIQTGKKYNAIGFINAGWQDDAQTITRMSYPDMAYGSIAAWQSEPTDKANFFTKYSRAQYTPALAGLFEKAHRSLYQAESLIRKSVGLTDPAFWANPFTESSRQKIENNKENLHNGRLAAEDAQVYIRDALQYGIDTTSLIAMLCGARMLDFIGMKYIYAGEIMDFWKQLSEKPDKIYYKLFIALETNSKNHGRIQDMLDAIFTTKEIFQRAWQNEFTPFRLGPAVGKYDLEYQFWLKAQRRLSMFNYNEDEPLPLLESFFKME